MGGSSSRIAIPEGTQSERQFRLKGKGMPPLRGTGYGDLYVHCGVETPVNLTRRQKELLREFEAESEGNNPECQGFFERVKAFFDSAKT